MKVKTSVSIPEETLTHAKAIAKAMDRTTSWVIHRAIEIGLPGLPKITTKKNTPK